MWIWIFEFRTQGEVPCMGLEVNLNESDNNQPMGYDFDKCQEQYEGGLGGRDLELVKL
jgi:hypothetical protein